MTQNDEPAKHSLHMFVVYRGPKDYPEFPFAVRRWEISSGATVPREAWGARTLEAARSSLPPELVMLAPAKDDDPTIVEVWT